jgi:hypothetical protein
MKREKIKDAIFAFGIPVFLLFIISFIFGLGFSGTLLQVIKQRAEFE